MALPSNFKFNSKCRLNAPHIHTYKHTRATLQETSHRWSDATYTREDGNRTSRKKHHSPILRVLQQQDPHVRREFCKEAGMVGVYAQVAESLQKQAKTFNSLWFPQHMQVLIACDRFDGNRKEQLINVKMSNEMQNWKIVKKKKKKRRFCFN